MSDEQEVTADGTEPDETDIAASRLEAEGDRAGALELRLARSERALKRERGERKTLELASYKDELVKEFEYADPDLISGKTKAEMKASAERFHNAVAKTIEKKGLTGKPAEKVLPTKEDFGQTPPMATEAVTGEAPMTYPEMLTDIREGKMSRGQVLADLAKNGAREIKRPNIAASIRGRAEGAQAEN